MIPKVREISIKNIHILYENKQKNFHIKYIIEKTLLQETQAVYIIFGGLCIFYVF